ncbi:hypothetical protein GUITHDRAFT_116409 [Guillardia theta CCMP2712]|uniref:EF-hand domain-containing protein n=1 Tax=Guillardia theta (strain CCMP2712) TaxID=905079 RepID=L1IMG5_GUITC|nr:hypothetical protein GUITHDRAFT_116409 [Guillardia theta CCMP2712]EKX37446.1 hypothetical protein GUITHDRAFT_116409 [Guillardia theta CCMP2712]|eukprot:XP_005824426.1 hypothetical protein GUITHDRAFT_116409 [Guillardia theta CCMP2712]
MNVELFDQIDTNGDGFLSVKEIQQALTSPEVNDTIRVLFETFDENEDGLISRDEAMKKLVQIPAGKEKLIEHFNAIDVNGDGVLTYEEFYEGMKDQMPPDEIERVYHQLDKDNDECITLDEFIMSQIMMCHSNLKSSQVNIDRSTACLTEVMQNLRRGDKMGACMKMLQDARKRQLMTTWPSKKALYKKTPLSEYKTKVQEIYEFYSNGQDFLDKAGVIEALGKFGKHVDDTQLSKLLAQVGSEGDAGIDREHFVLITYKLLAKSVKSKAEQRLAALSKPKNKTGELTVEDHLEEMEAQAKQSEAQDKPKKSDSKGAGKLVRRASISGVEKVAKKTSAEPKIQRTSSSAGLAKKAPPNLQRSHSVPQIVTCPIRFEFDRLDCNGDGTLSHDELFEGLKHRMEQDELAELFDFMDSNGDGMITFEEFYEAKKKIAEKKPHLAF